jgi:hypothetical protein
MIIDILFLFINDSINMFHPHQLPYTSNRFLYNYNVIFLYLMLKED